MQPKQQQTLDLPFSWRKLWLFTGPGFLMSLAYVDPGNLESDLQSGAYTGYQLIWVVCASTLAGLVLQILSARLGVVSGLNLAEHCAREYSSTKRIILWLMAEVAIIGGDIQEVIGSAIAFRILFGIPLWVGCLLTGLDTFTFLGFHAAGMRCLEAFFCVLIGTMCACFFVNFTVSNPDVPALINGFVPQLNDYAAVQAVGTIGAIIMPHNLFLHSALVKSRQVPKSDALSVREANKYFAIEAALALFVSFLINVAVIGVFASKFFAPQCAMNPSTQTACVPLDIALDSGNSIYNFYDGSVCSVVNGTVSSTCPTCNDPDVPNAKYCQQIGLSDAGQAITSVLGNAARTFWAIGLLASGQASTMTGTFAGQFVMEGFLDIKVSSWKRVFFTRSVSLVPAVIVAVISKTQQSESDIFDEWLNVLQSIQLPFALVPLIAFTSKKRIMGEFRNSRGALFGVTILTVLIMLANFGLVVKFISSTHWFDADAYIPQWISIPLGLTILVSYLGFLLSLILPDLIQILEQNKKNKELQMDSLNQGLLSTWTENPPDHTTL